MTTRWGTCNTTTKKIWFNLQLDKKPIECLEYIILHELTHLKVKNHGKDFVENIEKYMPYWRDLRNLLNDSKLDYMNTNIEED
jgi:predicted metal-dependent hydrolase